VGVFVRVGRGEKLRRASHDGRIHAEQNVQSVRTALFPNSLSARVGLQVQTASVDPGHANAQSQLHFDFEAGRPDAADADEAELDSFETGNLRGQRARDDCVVDRAGTGFGHSRGAEKRGRPEAQRSQERFLLQRGKII